MPNAGLRTHLASERSFPVLRILPPVLSLLSANCFPVMVLFRCTANFCPRSCYSKRFSCKIGAETANFPCSFPVSRETKPLRRLDHGPVLHLSAAPSAAGPRPGPLEEASRQSHPRHRRGGRRRPRDR